MSERQAAYNAGETEAIKYCPYCREPDDLIVAIVTPDDKRRVVCLTCDASGPLANNEADAIMLHNAAANALEAANDKASRSSSANRVLTQIIEETKAERDEAHAILSTISPAEAGESIIDNASRIELIIKGLKDGRDEAVRLAALRLKDCETMANEAEKYKQERDEARKINETVYPKYLQLKEDVINARVEIDALQKKCNGFESLWLAAVKQRDEARAIARRLWREKQAEKQCPACRGDGYVIVDIMGYSNGRMQKCFFCNGTGKVTK